MADRDFIEALEKRTKHFAIDVVRIVRAARRQPELWSACQQLNDAAGSVAANHRAMGRGRSDKEFASKLQTVAEESDESAHWLQQLKTTNRDAELQPLIERVLREGIELRNIFAKAKATTRERYFPEEEAHPPPKRHREQRPPPKPG